MEIDRHIWGDGISHGVATTLLLHGRGVFLSKQDRFERLIDAAQSEDVRVKLLNFADSSRIDLPRQTDCQCGEPAPGRQCPLSVPP